MDERQPPVLLVIERHRQAFTALERHDAIADQLDEDSDEWAFEQLEMSRLEDEVEAAAIAMTTVAFSSIKDVVAVLAYIDDFSRGRKSGYLLWPEEVPIGDEKVPWSFAILRNVRQILDIT